MSHDTQVGVCNYSSRLVGDDSFDVAKLQFTSRDQNNSGNQNNSNDFLETVDDDCNNT